MAPNGSTPAETVLASGALDPAAIHRQPNLINSRAAARPGPDGRPIPSSPLVHGIIGKRVACESCGLLFGDVGSLKRHASRSHRMPTGKALCIARSATHQPKGNNICDAILQYAVAIRKTNATSALRHSAHAVHCEFINSK